MPTHDFSINDINPAVTFSISVAMGFVAATAGANAFEASDVGKYVQICP
jgi:hypothetical protein